MVKVDSLSHVGLWVRDLGRSVRWYEEMLGFVLTDRLGPLVQLPPERAGEPFTNAGKGALQQMAFEAESLDALHAAHEFLARKGVKILLPPMRQKQSPGWKFYFADPDGNKLEIYTGMKRVAPDYGRHYGKWPEGAA
ncbi:MAG: VOC family protein [Candidatus Tectomicrobia bacterium]|uniref:VOC family protein n=1 Tax=Tectimicrobiota bacterium TaxID=2528274 RepID=A0A932MNT8_UNCTE|nr:VOC family protein [Candidatus Tectomicrobia bacterium]